MHSDNWCLSSDLAVYWFCKWFSFLSFSDKLVQWHIYFKRRRRKKTESRWDQEEGGELDSQSHSHKEVRRFCGSRWDQEEGGGAGLERCPDFFCLSCFPAVELQTLPLWLFSIAVGTAIAWYGSCCAMLGGHCLNILLFWRQSMVALLFWVGACLKDSLFFPTYPTHPHP